MQPKRRSGHCGGENVGVAVDQRLKKMCDVRKALSGNKPNAAEALQILDRLLRCLQSQNPSTKCDSFVTLVILLTVNNHIKTEQILDVMNKILVSDGDHSRGEKRNVREAKILSLGAILRSERIASMKYQVLNDILGELVTLAEKRTSLLIIATPFICELLHSVNPGQKKKLDLVPLQALLNTSSKQQNDSLFKIGLTAYRLGYELTSAFMESMESIVDTVIGFVKYEDKECLKILFQYLLSIKETKQFWKLFLSKLGPYHFDLLHATIVSSIENGCPLNHIIRKKAVMPLIGLLRNDRDRESQMKAMAIFRLLLDWDPKNPKTSMKPKHRASAVNFFFQEATLSFEYRALSRILRRLTTFLTTEELDLVFNICQPQTSLESRGGIATLTFLSRLPLLRNTRLETKLSIAKELFHNALCEAGPEAMANKDSTPSPEILAMRKKVSREGFASALKSHSAEYLSALFSHVKSVVMGKAEGLTLGTPVSNEDIANFKIITKLLKKMEDEDLKNILRTYGIYIVVDSAFASKGLENLIPLCNKTLSMERRSRAFEIVQFILSVISEEKVIFNYDAVFRKLLQDKVVGADSVQQFIKVIDIEMEQLEGEDDGEDGTEEDDDEEADVDIPFQKSNGFANKNEEDDDTTENSDEESINMDDASDTELERMDAAIANVFSTKKRVKAERKLDEGCTLRALYMIGLLLRRYRVAEDGAIVLMLITPCLNLLRKSVKQKKSYLGNRVAFVVKNLNKVTKVTNADTFDKQLVKNVVEDINEILAKRLEKRARALTLGTLRMVQKCFAPKLKSSLNGNGGYKKEAKKRKLEVAAVSNPIKKSKSKKPSLE